METPDDIKPITKLESLISAYLPELREYAIDYSSETDQYWIIVWIDSLQFYPLQYITHQLRKIIVAHRVDIVDVELSLHDDQ